MGVTEGHGTVTEPLYGYFRRNRRREHHRRKNEDLKIDQNLRDQIEQSDIKTVKTRKHYRKYLLFLNFGV